MILYYKNILFHKNIKFSINITSSFNFLLLIIIFLIFNLKNIILKFILDLYTLYIDFRLPLTIEFKTIETFMKYFIARVIYLCFFYKYYYICIYLVRVPVQNLFYQKEKKRKNIMWRKN
jgi:hypothetical protein